mmetsp:Transcript_19884/g.29334  ORF Transcript_19884/g.29334 Transcript_19884/m.29334 type:complete len:388 (+) Transcript_19884:167-1330(+)
MAMFKRRSRSALGVIFGLLLLALTTHGASNEDADADNNTHAFPEKQWGSYYDPSNVFCGKYDCYKILGFDFEQWGKSPPDKNDLTQSYRMLSKRWHPDKNKDKNANARFMKINKAYKVLTTKKLRKEYDYLRGRSDEYFFKYGSVTYAYKPKTDTLFVIFALLLAGSIFTWYAQKNRWQQIANRVVKDAVEGLKAGEGGSTESISLRLKAEEILKQKQEVDGVDFSDLFPVPVKNKGKVKKTKKETKVFENELVRPIIQELVLEIQDFGAGFHQPTWRDVLVVRMVKWPVVIVKEIMWQGKYYSRRLAKAELNDVEKEVLTSRAVGPLAWESAKEKDREEMISMELWNMENLEEWWELQEVKKLSSKEQKLYGKMKKQQLKKGNKAD